MQHGLLLSACDQKKRNRFETASMWGTLIIASLAFMHPVSSDMPTLYVLGDAVAFASESGFVQTPNVAKDPECASKRVTERAVNYLSVPGTPVVPVTVSICGIFRDSDFLRALDWLQVDIQSRSSATVVMALDLQRRSRALLNILRAKTRAMHARVTMLVTVPGYWDTPISGTLLLPFTDATTAGSSMNALTSVSCSATRSPLVVAALAGCIACTLLASMYLCSKLCAPRIKAAATKLRSKPAHHESRPSDVLCARSADICGHSEDFHSMLTPGSLASVHDRRSMSPYREHLVSRRASMSTQDLPRPTHPHFMDSSAEKYFANVHDGATHSCPTGMLATSSPFSSMEAPSSRRTRSYDAKRRNDKYAEGFGSVYSGETSSGKARTAASSAHVNHLLEDGRAGLTPFVAGQPERRQST